MQWKNKIKRYNPAFFTYIRDKKMIEGNEFLEIHEKLELIRQIHKEQEENERALYYRGMDSRSQTFSEANGAWSDFFRLRFLLAVLLFLGLFVMEKKDMEIGGLKFGNITEYIGQNMDLENLFDK